METRIQERLSVRRLARCFEESASSVGRWVAPRAHKQGTERAAGSKEDDIALKIRALCMEGRNRTFGHRRIGAMLKRVYGLVVNRKKVLRLMRGMGLLQERIRHKEARPRRMHKMRPTRPNEAWQIDMTSFQLGDLTALFLIVVIDCYTRQLVGWALERRCRAAEWTAAVRMALEARGLAVGRGCDGLTLRSDNGCQPCSREFRAYIAARGVAAEYTGYNAADDNAFVERVIRTIKEEEIWPSQYETYAEACSGIAEYLRYYNGSRIHAALDYATPDEAYAAALVTLAAA